MRPWTYFTCNARNINVILLLLLFILILLFILLLSDINQIFWWFSTGVGWGVSLFRTSNNSVDYAYNKGRPGVIGPAVIGYCCCGSLPTFGDCFCHVTQSSISDEANTIQKKKDKLELVFFMKIKHASKHLIALT